MDRRKFLTNSGLGIAGGIFMSSYTNELFAEKIYDSSIKPKTAKYIWTDPAGLGRNLYSNFRKSFKISQLPSEAFINIFADSSYQIFINDRFVNQGPVRFDPNYPVYDSLNIAPFLSQGENVIAIRVNYFGCRTYKSMDNRAGLITWGIVKAGATTINLDSNPDNWKAIPAAERSRFVNKQSFALNCSDYFDQSKEQAGWKSTGFDDSKWPAPVALANQQSWGMLALRQIPLFGYNEIKNYKVKTVFPLVKNEEVYSIFAPIPEFYNDRGWSQKYVAFYTWVYSETDQTIPVSLFWGEYWINGNEQKKGILSETNNLKITDKWELKKGWNHVFGKVEPYFDAVAQYFGFPLNSGIKISADKNPDTKVLFRRMPIMDSKEESDKFIASKTLPYSPDETLSAIGGWVDVKAEDRAQFPAFETGWDTYGQAFECPETLTGSIYKLKNYPQGFSVLLDLDNIHLSYPIIKLKGVKGATMDFTCSEYIGDDHEHLAITHHYQSADRLVCDKNEIEWMPPHPRGIRYMNLTVRNASADVTIDSFAIRSGAYPMEEKGKMKSSDPLLNKIWDMCYLTQKTNMEDAYVDCVGRERGMYTRDTIIQYHNNLAAFGDQALMKRCLQLYAESADASGRLKSVFPTSAPYVINDFCMDAVIGFRAYYDNTGDKAFVAKYWPALMSNIKWYSDLSDKREDKLINIDGRKKPALEGPDEDLDPAVDLAGGLNSTGLSGTFNALYITALKDLQYLAIASGNKSDADKFTARINVISKSFAVTFWNDTKKCYADTEERNSHSIHVQMLAIRAGLISNEQLPGVKKHLTKRLKNVFINGYNSKDGVRISSENLFYLFNALYMIDMPELAEKVMKECYGWYLSQGYKTVPEHLVVSKGSTSFCHAWAASPVYFLSKKVLGVNFPKAPDFSEVEINVNTSMVTFAEGAFPHPKGGLVEVKWHTENDKRVFDYVRVPNGVTVKMVS